MNPVLNYGIALDVTGKMAYFIFKYVVSILTLHLVEEGSEAITDLFHLENT